MWFESCSMFWWICWYLSFDTKKCMGQKTGIHSQPHTEIKYRNRHCTCTSQRLIIIWNAQLSGCLQLSMWCPLTLKRKIYQTPLFNMRQSETSIFYKLLLFFKLFCLLLLTRIFLNNFIIFCSFIYWITLKPVIFPRVMLEQVLIILEYFLLLFPVNQTWLYIYSRHGMVTVRLRHIYAPKVWA